MSIIDTLKFLRGGASVRRCHTFPHLGEYLVGYHSFNMLAMLRALRPDAPVALIWAIVEHDLPERFTGDIPSPALWAGVVDRDHLNTVEEAILNRYLGGPSFKALSDDDKKWLKGLDHLELYLWCRDQQMLGNMFAADMGRRIIANVKNARHKYPPKILDLFFVLENDPWEPVEEIA